MAYNEHLADRIRHRLHEHKVSYNELKMMGGLCFMVDDKMCVGIVKEDLMARIGPEIYEEVLLEDGIRPMEFTRRPMVGYIFASPESIDREDDLDKWVNRCLEFNPRAKSSKKKKKASN
jgi:TfoX/Sxy family transcriptional regulator of competence genes